MKVEEGRISGAFSERTATATRYEREFLVTGVRADGRQLVRIQSDGRIPNPGDPYPEDSKARCESVQVSPADSGDNTIWTVVARYTTDDTQTTEGLSLSDPIEIRYESRVITERTIYDRFGKKMSVSYIQSLSEAAGSTRWTVRKTHLIELERPGTVISITRTTRDSPAGLNQLYGGKVNSGDWGGYSRYQVLCEGFEGSGERGAGLWRVTGIFYPSPLADGTWRTQMYSKDTDGAVPPDARIGRGIEQFEPYDIAPLRNSGFTP